ncbi:MAG: D-alanyl-D-alanine carboxypeptidase [Firmicutes bacterium]|nr:D-alanyl-D-alanine carboxypeptidase [Bacillota bacterium]MDY5041979.1 D-alanyl-D-alanine carboxypeptidase family protein [Eubacteriales bacterium]
MSKDNKNGVITHKMSFNTRILCCVLIIMSVLGFANVLYNIKSSKDLDLQALAPYRSMCVISEDGQVLNQYNKDQQLAMASTTKIVTAIVTIENCDDLDEIITVDDKSVGIEGTSIYLRKKEQMSIRNLLYGLILASGNDAAMALACTIGGTEENFVEMMNKFALDLDLKNTHFANPHGLDSKGHYTSTYDLAVITNYALDNPVFKEIVSTKTKILNEGEPNVRYLRNKNKLLFSQDGCVGVKTGFTDNAGRCLVNACERNGFRVVSVVFNCGPMFEECDKLTEQAYNEYMVKTFVEPYNFVGNVSVIDGDKNEAFVVTIKGYSKIIKKSEEDMYKVDYDMLETAEAPINANTKMGTVKVTYNDEIIYEDSLYSTSEIKNINIKYKLDTIIKSWFI